MHAGIDGNEANVRFRVGSGQYAYGVLNELATYRDDRFTVYLKDKPFPDMPTQRKHFSYRAFGPKRFWTRFALPLRLRLGFERLDVFFTPGHYAPLFCPCPLVITLLDLSYLKFPSYFKKSDLLQLTHWTARSVKQARKIITISEVSKQDIINHYHIEPERVVVAYPGYAEEFRPQTDKRLIEKVKRHYGINGPYILFVGTMQPRKNIERLIEAFAFLKHEGVKESLVLVGKKGWLYEAIFSKAEKLGIAEFVKFTSYVKHEDLPLLIGGAKLYVLPSLYEGFGIPAIEAMASGTPVAVSNSSSLPEVVGDAGVLFDPYNPTDIARGMREILGSRTLAKTLSERGIERARRFNWKECGTITMNTLREVAGVQR